MIKTILLIEDEALIALNEKQELEKYGYTVIHVADGNKAVRTVVDEKWRIDLV